jgi:hypothetical protein
MHLIRFAGLAAASLLLCGCASTYKGRVITTDGSPVGGAQIQALGSWSLFSATPFDWSSGTHVRGSASSFPDGSFQLNASAFRVQELTANSQAGTGTLAKPSPGKPSIIMVKPKTN